MAEDKNNQNESNIELITEEQYNALSDEEKENYIRYNPSMTDEAVAALIKQANAQLEVLGKLGPAIDQIKVMPQPLPAEQVTKALDKLEKSMSLLDPIEALTSVPVIGGLAKAVVNILNSIFELIGFLFLFEFYLGKGATIFTDQVCQTWEDLDVEKVNEDIKEVKKMSEEQKTAGIKGEIDYSKIPTAEMKNKVSELETSVKTCTSTLDILGSATRAMDIVVKGVYAQMSYDKMIKSAGKALQKAGINTKPLEQPTEAQMKAFEKMMPNPKANIDKMNNSLNKLKEKKYISIDDMKKLEEGGTTKKEISLSDKLSEHFILNDLCYSNDAIVNKITNMPNEEQVENLKALCVNVLEKVYAHYGKPAIGSGFRCSTLNQCVGGVNESQHCNGEAADIEIIGVSNLELARWIKANCDFDQLILENARNLDKDPNSGWVHVSYRSSGNRKDDKTMYNGKTAQENLISKNKKTKLA